MYRSVRLFQQGMWSPEHPGTLSCGARSMDLFGSGLNVNIFRDHIWLASLQITSTVDSPIIENEKKGVLMCIWQNKCRSQVSEKGVLEE